jgi:hypothetical protein
MFSRPSLLDFDTIFPCHPELSDKYDVLGIARRNKSEQKGIPV